MVKKFQFRYILKKSPIFLHLTGFPGSGKTTIAKLFDPKKFLVQDLDDLFPTKEMSSIQFKQHMETKIDTLIKKNKNVKRIILVGTACLEPDPTSIPIIHAEHKIWFDVSLKESCKRAVKRQLEWAFHHQADFFTLAQRSSKEDFAIYLENYFSVKKRQEDWKDLLPIYETFGYARISEEEASKYLLSLI